MRPVVGIPCFAAERAGTLRPIYGNNQAYVRAIERAGGAPLLIPPGSMVRSRCPSAAHRSPSATRRKSR